MCRYTAQSVITPIRHQLYTSKSRKVKTLLQQNDAVIYFLLFQNVFLAIKIRPVYLRKHKKYKNAQNLSPSENFSGSFQPSSVCTHFLKQLGLPYSILIHFSACCEMLSLSVKMALSDPKYRDDTAVSWPCAQPFS